MLKGKTVVVGVCGGIAAYKVCELVSRLKKAAADVYVVMTKHATEFVAPLTFETLSGNRVVSDMFDRDFPWEVEHISLAKKADLFILAPCTANVMAKYACGIADDFLTTTLLAAKCPVLIAPAMNCAMLAAEATVHNMEVLERRGSIFIDSQSGRLACGDVGSGRMAEPEQIFGKAVEILCPKRDFTGKTVLITAGATREPIDPVRFISNRSGGKMGMALCRAVKRRGGKVILVAGITDVSVCGCDELINVQTTEQMHEAVMANLDKCDVVIKAAAPADYRSVFQSEKIKSESFTLKMNKNPDIAKAVGERKGDKRLVIFCAETSNLKENARKKLADKNADMVVANDVTAKGAGFDCDTNIVTVITPKKETDYPIMSKADVAEIILDELSAL